MPSLISNLSFAVSFPLTERKGVTENRQHRSHEETSTDRQTEAKDNGGWRQTQTKTQTAREEGEGWDTNQGGEEGLKKTEDQGGGGCWRGEG